MFPPSFAACGCARWHFCGFCERVMLKSSGGVHHFTVPNPNLPIPVSNSARTKPKSLFARLLIFTRSMFPSPPPPPAAQSYPRDIYSLQQARASWSWCVCGTKSAARRVIQPLLVPQAAAAQTEQGAKFIAASRAQHRPFFSSTSLENDHVALSVTVSRRDRIIVSDFFLNF